MKGGIPKEVLTPNERLELARKRRVQQLRLYDQYEKQHTKAVKHSKLKKQKRVEFPSEVKLISAVIRKDAQEVESLLKEGSDPNEGNEDGVTGLHQSAIDNSRDIVNILLKHKANPNARDKEMWTPLHAASACGNKEICKILLDFGADLVAMNGDGNMPYDICEHQETLDFIEGEMLKRGITQQDVDSKRGTREKTMLDDIKEEIARTGKLPTYKGQEGESLLHISSSNGFIDVIELLVSHSASLKSVDKDLWQPLHCAIHWGQLQAAEVLIRKGADLNARTRAGFTALDLCSNESLKRELIEVQEEIQKNVPRRTQLSLRNSKSSSASIKKSEEKAYSSTKDKLAEGYDMMKNMDLFYGNSEEDTEVYAQIPIQSPKKGKKDRMKKAKERRRSSTSFFNALIRGSKKNATEEESSVSKFSVYSVKKDKKAAADKPCQIM